MDDQVVEAMRRLRIFSLNAKRVVRRVHSDWLDQVHHIPSGWVVDTVLDDGVRIEAHAASQTDATSLCLRRVAAYRIAMEVQL